MDYKVLMIDDDELIARSTSDYFNIVGVKTAYVTSYDAAIEFLEKNEVSLLLLDINLGEDSGFELCQIIRRTMNLPIFFISARSSEDDMLLALTIGGDDYICKPYSLSVLLAKVKAALKRYEAAEGKSGEQTGNQTGNRTGDQSGEQSGDQSSNQIEGGKVTRTASKTVMIGKTSIDLARAVVLRDGKEYPLKAMEFRILVYMLKNKNRIIPKDEFFEKVWETEFVGDVTLNVHIRHLREKIEEDPGNPMYIKTVWGTGFILEDKE